MTLSLGSWWKLVVFLLIKRALIWRLFDEENFLTKNLPGYAEYRNKVRYRLIPFIWSRLIRQLRNQRWPIEVFLNELGEPSPKLTAWRLGATSLGAGTPED
jgi:hypothetical protein